jgi:hypothetical protein
VRDRRYGHNLSMRREVTKPSGAVLQMLEDAGELDRDWGVHGAFVVSHPDPPAPPPPQPRIPPPDWSLAGEVAIDEAELKREPESLPRPAIPAPDWKQEGEP